MTTNVIATPQPQSAVLVEQAKAMVAGYVPAIESAPPIAEIMHEIETAMNEQHGGPLTTPELEFPVPLTWDEVRHKIAQEKIAPADPPAPTTAPTPPVADPSGALVLTPGRSAAQVFQEIAASVAKDPDPVVPPEDTQARPARKRSRSRK